MGVDRSGERRRSCCSNFWRAVALSIVGLLRQSAYTSSVRLIVTPLRGPKIVAILKAGFSLIVISIYRCGAGEAQAVSPQPIKLHSNECCYRRAGSSIFRSCLDVALWLYYRGSCPIGVQRMVSCAHDRFSD